MEKKTTKTTAKPKQFKKTKVAYTEAEKTEIVKSVDVAFGRALVRFKREAATKLFTANVLVYLPFVAVLMFIYTLLGGIWYAVFMTIATMAFANLMSMYMDWSVGKLHQAKCMRRNATSITENQKELKDFLATDIIKSSTK